MQPAVNCQVKVLKIVQYAKNCNNYTFTYYDSDIFGISFFVSTLFHSFTVKLIT